MLLLQGRFMNVVSSQYQVDQIDYCYARISRSPLFAIRNVLNNENFSEIYIAHSYSTT